MEKTIKHELYKHGSYLISLKESGSEFVNIDDEIKKNEELFQLASKKDLQPDLNIKNNNNNPTPWSQIMTDHQPAFSVGEYYFYKSMENVLHILKITAVMGNIVEAGFLDTETGKLINTRIELDKKYVQPATAEQIAEFKLAQFYQENNISETQKDQYRKMLSNGKMPIGPWLALQEVENNE